MTHAGKLIYMSAGTFLSLISVIKASLLGLVATAIITALSHKSWIVYDNIFSGVFDLMAIFAGFMSTFYMFITTKDNEFLRAIARTKTYGQMKQLLKVTIIWSVVVIGFSYVLMVAPPKNLTYVSWGQVVVFVWCLNVFLIGVNFWRCVGQFSMVVRAEK